MKNRIPLLPVFVFAAIALTARAADLKPDDEGFIRDWLLLAPYSITADSAPEEIDKQQIPDEAKLAPKEGDKQKIGDKELTWKKIRAKEYFFDINELLGSQNEDVIAYAVCYVDAAAEMRNLVLAIGSNDQCKVYVNGKELIKFTETRVVEKDSSDAKGVTLNKGTNTIVFKIANQANNWGGALRFKTADGKPVKDITVKLAK